MKNKISIAILFGILLFPQLSIAQVPTAIPFGGRITMVHDCFCSGGWMMYVFDSGKGVVLPIVYQFGASRLNASWNVFTPGVQVLGSMVSPGVCSIALSVCTPVPAAGFVSPPPLSGVGTTLLPSF